MTTTVRIEITRRKCQGYGKCVATAPAVFRLADDRKVEIVDAAGAADDVIVAAAKGCPYRVISVAAADGTVLFPPPRK